MNKLKPLVKVFCGKDDDGPLILVSNAAHAPGRKRLKYYQDAPALYLCEGWIRCDMLDTIKGSTEEECADLISRFLPFNEVEFVEKMEELIGSDTPKE